MFSYIFGLGNSRQLEFYQSARLAEGWKMNERFAESQRTKKRKQIISNKRQGIKKTVEIRLCLQNVRGLNSKLKQDQLMNVIDGENPFCIALDETKFQSLIGINNQKYSSNLTIQKWRSIGVKQWEILNENNKNSKAIRSLELIERVRIPTSHHDSIHTPILERRTKGTKKQNDIHDKISDKEVPETENNSDEKLLLQHQKSREKVKQRSTERIYS
ncbi:hypothetical protein OXYTRIMIC_315 [Oxytricha trifallax]|uniref:Uncharacterized protein n=1 Tax=Oxytricha trifallax TaxID=1172189 RepID=A0A073HYE2_9SPIT|nr:hypothetical protein OXYTRIMIC_315 [Oxytricha trifallax]